VTRSEEVIERVRKSFGNMGCGKSVDALIAEYEIAIAQNLAVEEAVHALAKKIEHLPGA
jgi:hypothetical protein